MNIKNLILALLVTAATASAQDTGVMVELKGAHLIVPGVAVRLQDLAQVSALAPQGRDPRVVESRLRSVEILRFKRGMMEARIDHADIKLALKRLGFTDVSIAGAKEIRISRKSKLLDNRRVLDMVRAHVRSALAGVDDQARVEFVRRIDPIRIPAGRYSMDLRFEADPKNPDYLGDSELRMVAEIDGVIEEIARVPVRISRQVPLLRLTRNVRRGDIIGREDLVFEERTVSQLGPQLFYRLEDVVGLIAVRDLKTGTEIMKTDVKARPVIRKGDLVSVRARKGSLQVETLCQALQDGAPGERILFKNLSSERTVEATVVDRQIAEIVLDR